MHFSNLTGDPFWISTLPVALAGWVCQLVGSVLVPSEEMPVFDWWILTFQALVDLFVIYVVILDRTRLYRGSVLALLSVALVYMTVSANNFTWRNSSQSAVAASGAMLQSIINILWILFFGTTSKEAIHRWVESYAVEKH